MDKLAATHQKIHLRRLFAWAVAVAVLVFGIGVVATGLLYAGWSGPYRTVTHVADLDGDGDLDVIAAHTRWESASTSFAGITQWTNQGDGQFSSHKLHGGHAAATGDVDQDGDADLLFLDFDFKVDLNQGGDQAGTRGVFGRLSTVRPPGGWRGHPDMAGTILAGDLDDDGDVDGLITWCCYGRTGTQPDDGGGLVPSFSWVWINAWQSATRPAPAASALNALDGLPVGGAALGDVDGDGDLDLFAAIAAPTAGQSDSQADLVLHNDGTGHFADSGQRLGSSDSSAVALADVDGDGDLDALVGTRAGALLWLNQGGAQAGEAGMFQRSEQRFSGGQTRSVFFSDLDGDADQDAVLGRRRQAKIWWNDGQGTFTPSDLRFRYSIRHGLALADFDGDGSPDLFAGAGGNGYRLWLNDGTGRFARR